MELRSPLRASFGLWAAGFDKGMSERLFRCDALVWIQMQHLFQEVNQVGQLRAALLASEARPEVLLDCGVCNQSADLQKVKATF